MIIDERNFVEFEDNDYLDAVEYSKKMRNALNDEFDKINNNLSSNDYTDEEKQKLASLSNYDDTELKAEIQQNTTARHTHSNKEILDNTDKAYTQAEREEIDANLDNTKTELNNAIQAQNVLSSTSYANAIKESVEQVKQAQIHSSGAVLQDVKVYGESVQETREGYNLLNIKDGTYTNNFGSITFKNGVGTILYNTTPSDGGNNFTVELNKDSILKNGSYTLVNGSNETYPYIVLRRSDGGVIGQNVFGDKGHTNFTLNDDETLNYIALYIDYRYSVDRIIYPMLLEGTYTKDNVPEFQEYGAMPSVEFSSAIESVGSNVNFFSTEKLHDNNITSQNKYKILDSNSFEIDISVAQTYKWMQFKFENLKKNTDYYLSFKSNYSNSTFSGFITVHASNLTQITNFRTEDTFNTGDNTTIYIRFHASGATAITNKAVFTDVKLEKNTKKTGFTKYGCGGIDYKTTGKNMLPYPYTYSTSRTINGVDFTINEDGTIIANGTATANTEFLLYGKYNVEDNINNFKNFTLTGFPCSASVNTYFFAIWQYEHGKHISAKNYAKDAKIIAENNADGICICLVVLKNSVLDNITFKPMTLNVDNNLDMEYEPYKELNTTIELPQGVELCKINDIQDYISADGVIHKKIGKFELGTQNWNITKSSGNEDRYYCYTDAFDIFAKQNETNNTNFVCNIASSKSDLWSATVVSKDTCNIANSATNKVRFMINRIDIDNQTGTTLSEKFNNLLLSKSAYFLAELAEENTTQSLEATEIAKLQKLQTYLGTNNITTSAPISFVYSEDNYYTIEKLRQENKSLEERLSVVENLLSSTATASLLLENVAQDNESEVM